MDSYENPTQSKEIRCDFESSWIAGETYVIFSCLHTFQYVTQHEGWHGVTSLPLDI